MSWTKTLSFVAVLAFLGLGVVSLGRAEDAKSIDEEGFIKEWLLLAPIPLAEGEETGAANDKEQIKDEAKLAPKDGDKVKVGETELTWKKHTATEYFFDFNAFVGKETERAVGYAVTYVVCEDDVKHVSLKIGSDDQCKVYLNGKEVGKVADERATDKDQNSYDGLALKKGSNVLVFKVVNASQEWSGCARFTDKEGKPLKGLKVELKK